jgi:hypothetical protein
MLMQSTIEEATMEMITQARRQQPTSEGASGAGGAGEGSSSLADEMRGAKRAREDGDEEEGKQAALLNALKLLRHEAEAA